MSVIGRMFDLYKTIKDASADGKLSKSEMKDMLLDFKKILQDLAKMLGQNEMSGLLLGMGELVEGIGKVIENPERGVDDLLEGIGKLLLSIAPFTKK